MAQLNHFQNAIITVFTEYHEWLSGAKTIGAVEVRDELILDTERNHFQIVTIGWQKQRFFHETALHIDIINDKIWVQQNNTEFDVVEELLLQGISKQDIVLGFIAPTSRVYSGFAVA